MRTVKECIGLIITAAGYGIRMNTDKPKMLLEINGNPLLYWSIIPFLKICSIEKYIITYPHGYLKIYKTICNSLFQPKHKYHLVEGGNSRQNSIKKALLYTEKLRWIGVHDGARPLVRRYLIEQLIIQVKKLKACIPALPVKDTIKRIKGDRVIETLKRNTLYLAQTPQFFERDLLVAAYQYADKTNYIANDDASLVEQLGKPIFCIKGDYQNIKLTVPEDIQVASVYLK